MDPNQLQQLVLFKYFIETIQKQSVADAIDLPRKIVQQRGEQNEERLINANGRSTNSICARSDGRQDGAYCERRRKNNEAAKRSRDARRAKEDEMALRAALLEQENVKLRLENVHLKQENVQLRCQISTSTDS